MELFFSYSSLFGLLLTTLIILSIFKVIAVVRQTWFYWKGKGIPYLPLRESFVTNWKIFMRYVTFAEHYAYLYNYFPDAKYSGILDFETPAVLLRDPELIKDVLVKDFENFHDHQHLVDESVDPTFGKNVFSLRGDRWREMKRTLSPSFTPSKMKVMFDLVSKCSHEFVNYLVDSPELCTEIDTKQIFTRYTTDVIATTAFGISVNSLKDQDNEFYIAGWKSVKALDGILAMFKFKLMREFPGLAKWIGIEGLVSSSTSAFFERIIGETIKVREEQGIVRPDMIHILMQAREKNGSKNMTLVDIVPQAFFFFFTGFESSSTLMCFVAHELALNPDVQDRLRGEVLQHLTEENKFSYESLSKMIYMDMVISETLRKYPTAVFINRICTKSYELPSSQLGYKSIIVEPDSLMIIPVYALHRDPNYFPNPDKFEPERFSKENKNKIIPYSYLPFGEGPRKCIGNRFVFMETKILVAHLLQKFILKRTAKTVEPMIYDKKKITLVPKDGFWIGLEKREAC